MYDSKNEYYNDMLAGMETEDKLGYMDIIYDQCQTLEDLYQFIDHIISFSETSRVLASINVTDNIKYVNNLKLSLFDLLAKGSSSLYEKVESFRDLVELKGKLNDLDTITYIPKLDIILTDRDYKLLTKNYRMTIKTKEIQDGIPYNLNEFYERTQEEDYIRKNGIQILNKLISISNLDELEIYISNEVGDVDYFLKLMQHVYPNYTNQISDFRTTLYNERKKLSIRLFESFIVEEYSSLEELAESKNYSLDYVKDLYTILKSCNLDLYNQVGTKIEEAYKDKLESNRETYDSIVTLLKHGYVSETGPKNIDLIDYYLMTDTPITEFEDKLKELGMISPSTRNTVRKFVNKYGFTDPVSFDDEYLLSDAEGKSHQVTLEEKQAVADYLDFKKIPNNFLNYNSVLRRYIKGELDITIVKDDTRKV